jgi:uncharacterized ferritin-like protein (DUF455 family)
MELRRACLELLAWPDPVAKAQAVSALTASDDLDAQAVLTPVGVLPGRGARPALVPHTQIKNASLSTPKGHALLVHSIVHIERNAIDLALDICWRFAGMPAAFYLDWLRVAREEALHFTLLRNHLLTLGFDYGDFDAHTGLWDMAERTRDDVLARVALVPRTLEARGLDASPAVRGKLVSIGDHAGAAILDIILRDEIGHVAVGNLWYRWLCEQRGIEPVVTYAQLTTRYQAPRLKQPFNLDARKAAGFTDAELQVLQTP